MNNNLSGLPRYLFISGAGAGGAVLSGRALFPLVTRKPMISSRRHGCGGAGVLSGHARFPYIRREPIPITASHDLLSSRCSRHTDGQSGGRLPGEYSDKSAAVRRPPPPPSSSLAGEWSSSCSSKLSSSSRHLRKTGEPFHYTSESTAPPYLMLRLRGNVEIRMSPVD